MKKKLKKISLKEKKNWQLQQSPHTDLGAHVADGAHAGAGDAVHPRPEVLHDSPSASLHCQDAGNLGGGTRGVFYFPLKFHGLPGGRGG